MRSIIAHTAEIDDVKKAAGELMDHLQSGLPLQKNSCGILYYDYEMNGDELAGELSRRLGIDIIGCSSVATVDGRDGYLEMSALLTVLTADDCEFSVAVTQPLTEEGAGETLVQAYRGARQKIGQDPKLLFVIPPSGTSLVFDNYLPPLSEEAGFPPLIGGIPSSSGGAEKSVLLNGAFYTDRAAMLLISGNVRPVISLANIIETVSEKTGTITKAEGTELLEVDGKTFVDFIEGFGIGAQELLNPESIFFHKYPLLIEGPDAEKNGELPYVRIFSHVDPEKKSGISYAKIPENGTVKLAILRKEDLLESVRLAVKDLLAKIQAAETEDYHYSTVLCITCNARWQTLNPNYDSEAAILREMLPPGLNLSGYYSYGELCPVSVENGVAHNQLHHASIVFCAF